MHNTGCHAGSYRSRGYTIGRSLYLPVPPDIGPGIGGVGGVGGVGAGEEGGGGVPGGAEEGVVSRTAREEGLTVE